MNAPVNENGAPSVVRARCVGDDCSAEIERLMAKEPRDRVRCVRVFGDFYRCNWWAPLVQPVDSEPVVDWAAATTHRVRKSAFVRATVRAGELVIREAAPDGALQEIGR